MPKVFHKYLTMGLDAFGRERLNEWHGINKSAREYTNYSNRYCKTPCAAVFISNFRKNPNLSSGQNLNNTAVETGNLRVDQI